MAKRKKFRKPTQPQRVPDPAARKTTENAAKANRQLKRSVIATVADAIFEAIKRLFCKISQLIGRRHMKRSYQAIQSELVQMQAELKETKTHDGLISLWKRLEGLCESLRGNDCVSTDYSKEFIRLYNDAAPSARVQTKQEEQGQCLNDLLAQLIEIPVCWKGRTGSQTDCRPSGRGSITKNDAVAGYPETDCRRNEPYPPASAQLSSSALQEIERWRNQCDEMERRLSAANASYDEVSARADSLRDDLNEAKKEAEYSSQLYKTAQSDLANTQLELSQLERSSIPRDLQGLQQRLLEHYEALPNEVRELLSGILLLRNDLGIQQGRMWFEQNLDRIRAYIYGTVDTLPVLVKRGLDPQYFDDYYCLLLIQNNTHELLESKGLSVICPAKGDMFRKDHHDFSDRDLVWVDDPSRDNQIEATRRVGFTFRDNTQKVTVLRKALVRRCVFSSESLQSDSIKTTINTDDVQNDVAEADVAEPASDASFSADTEATCPSEQACPPDTPQPGKNCPEEELLTDNSEACPSDAEAPDAPRSVDDQLLDDLLNDKKETKG